MFKGWIKEITFKADGNMETLYFRLVEGKRLAAKPVEFAVATQRGDTWTMAVRFEKPCTVVDTIKDDDYTTIMVSPL